MAEGRAEWSGGRDVRIGRESASVAFVEVIGIAVVWALIAVVVQQGADRLLLRLPFPLSPPRWWWYSPIPWPRSILTALVFSALGALFVWLCVRAGIRGRLVLFGMCLALALMWAWSAVDSIGFFEQFGASYGLEFTRIGAPVRMSGTAGSVFGALLALLLLSRREQVATVGPTT
jgi:hypothetical protein